MQDFEFRELIQRVKDASPIDVVVGERVRLEKKGSLLGACCPFHEERTPSFFVDVRRQSWRCFGACAEGGDVIKFVERFDGLEFFEALELLAQGAGIEIPKRSADRRKREDDKAPLLDALAEAATLFRRALEAPEGEAARAYLTGRGLEPATLARFGVGWASDGGNSVTEHARRAAVPAAWLQAGLVRRGENGRGYDFFRARVMIPIADQLGRVVGFGGRLLPGDERSNAKYMNTGDTPVFHKGRLVYGWHLAKDAIRRERRVVLVEGYTDVMAAHQAGLEAVVAVLGTATTADHARLLRRSGAQRAILVFDGDEAGRRAVKRAIVGLLPTGIELVVVAPPDGADPCDLVLADGGRERFETLLDAAEPWFDWLVRSATADGTRRLEPTQLAAVVEEVFEMLEVLEKPVERDAYLARLAEAFGLSGDSVRAQFAARRRPKPARAASPGGRRTTQGVDAAPGTGSARRGSPGGGQRRNGPGGTSGDRAPSRGFETEPRMTESERRGNEVHARAYGQLLGALLADNSLIPVYRAHRGGCPDGPLARVFDVLLTAYDEDEVDPIDANHLWTCLGDDPARDLVGDLVRLAEVAESPAVLAADQVAWLARQEEERELERLRRAARPADGVEALVAGEPDEQTLRDLHARLRARSVSKAVEGDSLASSGAPAGGSGAASSGDPFLGRDALVTPVEGRELGSSSPRRGAWESADTLADEEIPLADRDDSGYRFAADPPVPDEPSPGVLSPRGAVPFGAAFDLDSPPEPEIPADEIHADDWLAPGPPPGSSSPGGDHARRSTEPRSIPS